MADNERQYSIAEFVEANKPKVDFYVANRPQDIINIIGAVFSKVRDHYLSFFHKDQFKTIRVKTQHESLSNFRSFMHSVPKKVSKPIIVFDPTGDIKLLEETLFTEVTSLRFPITEKGFSPMPVNAVPIMDFGEYIDQEKKPILGVTYTLNKYKLGTDIMMIFNSTAEQLNMYNYMVNNIRHRGKYTLEIDTSMVLDKAIMLNIAKVLKMKPDSDEFLQVVNQRSLYPVRKMNYSNGMWDYFIDMPILYHFDIPDMPSMNVFERSGMVEGVVYINSSIDVVVDIPSNFQLAISEKILEAPIKSNTIPPTPNLTYIPPYTRPKEIPRVLDGYMNLSALDIVFEEDNDQVLLNYVDMADFDIDIKNYIFSKEKISDYLKFTVYRDGELVNPLEENGGNIILKNVKIDTFCTVCAYVNLEKINKDGNARMKYIIGTLNIDDYYIRNNEFKGRERD